MRKIILVMLIPTLSHARLPAPPICTEIKKMYDQVHTNPNDHKLFEKYLNLLIKATISRSYPSCPDLNKTIEWFKFAEESKFPEGRKFIHSPVFRNTLDGGWAEAFPEN